MPDLSIVLIIVGATLFVSLLLKNWISDRFKIPAVTIYVILGVIGGISIVHVYNIEIIEELDFVSKIALGLISFVIGSELDKKVIKSLGKSIFFIAFFEAFLAFVLVLLAVYFIMGFPLYYALILGAVASATAPAATVYVIRQYKSKGPLTSTIMGVVGIDDAISLIIYVFASIFAMNMMKADADLSVVKAILSPVLSILKCAGIGAAAGYLYLLILKKVRDNEIIIMAIMGFIIALLGISEYLDISELLTIMTFGAFLSNANSFVTQRAKKTLESFNPIFLPLFFILAGARLNITLIGTIGLLGVVYTLARFTGKVAGASLGAVLGKASKNVKKLIGFSLIPQVGVAIALALSVNQRFGKGAFGKEGEQLASIVLNVLLFTTIFTEIVGPLLTKMALKKAGEIEAE